MGVFTALLGVIAVGAGLHGAMPHGAVVGIVVIAAGWATCLLRPPVKAKAGARR